MTKLLRQRLLQLVLVILGLSSLVFFLVRISGDPASAIAGADADPETLAAIRSNLGLNEPVLVQYVRFLGDLLVLDFGDSYQYRSDAMALVLDRFPASALLTILAMLIAVGLGVPAGVLGAVHRDGLLGRAVNGLAILGQSVPNFVLGLVLIMIFAVSLGWLPSFGGEGVMSLILPAVTLAAFICARQMRLVQAYTLEELGKGYVRTANSLGYRPRRIRYRHILRNVSVPMLSLVGLELGQFIAGSVVVESVFSWPGLGRLMVESVTARDYPVLQAGVFVIGVLVVLINFIVDLLYQVVDPRLKAQLVTR
ncbi:ABC transporter permease [Micromonospora sp. NPDC018662]|uniref:ABC transporter permease n=1 Tax=Micromonospora sp. NPDC018662 TaxID=3364238 RepID=UPI0037A8B133